MKKVLFSFLLLMIFTSGCFNSKTPELNGNYKLLNYQYSEDEDVTTEVDSIEYLYVTDNEMNVYTTVEGKIMSNLDLFYVNTSKNLYVSNLEFSDEDYEMQVANMEYGEIINYEVKGDLLILTKEYKEDETITKKYLKIDKEEMPKN